MTATRPVATGRATEDMRAALAAVGASARVHAVDLDTGAAVGIDPDEPVALASVFKIAVLLELARQAGAGERSLTDRIHVPADGRAPGPTGLSVMQDAVELSLRDLMTLMISISDNAATDVCVALAGIDRINATLHDLGLVRTTIVADCRTLLDDLARELGFDDAEAFLAFDAASSPERATELAAAMRTARAIDAVDTNVSTARETTRLLELIWNDEAAPAEACAEARRILGLQVFRDRLASGFPDEVTVSGKTGTLPFLRNEAGVVTYPDGGRYAVAVFARAPSPAYRQPDQDRVIGTVARIAVDHLRSVSSEA